MSKKSPSVTQLPLQLKNRVAFYIDGFLSPEECQEWINRAEAQGFEPALLNVGGGKQELHMDIRKSLRAIIDDFDFARVVWKRLEDFMPKFVWNYHQKAVPFQVNERMRVLKYTNPGDKFEEHYDGSFVRGDEFSMFTLLFNLNEEYTGCRTRFVDDVGTSFEAAPKVGRCLVHSHEILHEAMPLESGVKYIMRTDIMCRNVT